MESGLKARRSFFVKMLAGGTLAFFGRMNGSQAALISQPIPAGSPSSNELSHWKDISPEEAVEYKKKREAFATLKESEKIELVTTFNEFKMSFKKADLHNFLNSQLDLVVHV